MGKLKSSKGFTLIELLVVIVIIGVLATLATVALGQSRMKARDAKRVSDVRQIQNALELYFSETASYPPTEMVDTGKSIFNGVNTYMIKVPGNPSPYADGTCPSLDKYTYEQNGAASYTITYCLGGLTGTIQGGINKATPLSITDR